MYEKTYPNKRFRLSLEFVKKHINTSESILDLGVTNPFSEIMISEGYNVVNTQGEDLDEDRSFIEKSSTDVVTALEIFEHLLSPYEVLKSIKADKLIISVPLRLWFSSAYRSKTDMRDRHFHEFEDWQLDWLLEKTGWTIKDCQKWTNPVKKLGIRPLFRSFTNRYYIVYAERYSNSN
ncbi:MAG: methyltransferase [Winogradskyella sp.]|uniref:methyltransferase n=1 Tax=Winogradskyella sp. TaxID=1883156 RepID=UPI0025EA3F22|nr:methyltransferase [Winogradskyella sp.]NRB58344.1 methyltransferase [Winogradskyella sp.]